MFRKQREYLSLCFTYAAAEYFHALVPPALRELAQILLGNVDSAKAVVYAIFRVNSPTKENNMAFDAFLKIDGIPGESTDDKHKDWLEILSFNHQLDQPASATASSSGGATAERVNHGTFNVVHLYDRSSPKLADAVCRGTHIKEVTLELCRAGGDKQRYLEVKLEQVVISHLSTRGDGGGSFPVEVVSFSYGKIKWTYTQQKRQDGQAGGNIAAGWDLTTNKSYA
jgi:type VI secretion system secreted protein Hcp